MDTPVVALLAKLLLEVTQGETVALHGPPVRDLLAAEEVRHHRLATACPVASRAFFALPQPESRQTGTQRFSVLEKSVKKTVKKKRKEIRKDESQALTTLDSTRLETQ